MRPSHTLLPAADQPGMPGMRPVGGSSSNLAGQGVPMVTPAIMAQFAAAGGQPRPGQLPGVGLQGMQNLTLQQQQQIFLQHQQALMAQMAAGRAPSPGGGMITAVRGADAALHCGTVLCCGAVPPLPVLHRYALPQARRPACECA